MLSILDKLDSQLFLSVDPRWVEALIQPEQP